MTRHVDLTHIKTGDMLALAEPNRGFGDFRVTHRLLIVDRTTNNQVVCRDEAGFSGEWRFRKSDGKQVGQDYSHAELGTPELIARVRAQREVAKRASTARFALNDLEGKHLHQLNLTIGQLEALAMAWTAIKAMKSA